MSGTKIKMIGLGASGKLFGSQGASPSGRPVLPGQALNRAFPQVENVSPIDKLLLNLHPHGADGLKDETKTDNVVEDVQQQGYASKYPASASFAAIMDPSDNTEANVGERASEIAAMQQLDPAVYSSPGVFIAPDEASDAQQETDPVAAYVASNLPFLADGWAGHCHNLSSLVTDRMRGLMETFAEAVEGAKDMQANAEMSSKRKRHASSIILRETKRKYQEMEAIIARGRGGDLDAVDEDEIALEYADEEEEQEEEQDA